MSSPWGEETGEGGRKNKSATAKYPKYENEFFSFAYFAWFAVQFGMDNRRKREQGRVRDRNQRRRNAGDGRRTVHGNFMR